MSKALTDYDFRQLRRMVQELDAFASNAVTLPDLVSSLDGLLNALEHVDNQWKREFHRQWRKLEAIYADALDKSLSTISGEHVKLMNGAIADMRRLLAQKL